LLRIVAQKSKNREASGWRSAYDLQYAASRCRTNTDPTLFRTDAQDPQETRDEASMKNFLKLGMIALLAGALTGVMGPSEAAAQTQQRVDAKKDWSIFQAGADGQKVCWIVSQPTKTAAIRNGKTVSVNRGDIFLMVSIRPADGVTNEISFLSGYPFKKGSEVKTSVGNKNFTLFTEGENAWAPSAEDDAAMIVAFRKGARAKIEGVSSRGTKTIDTFSLSGFTAALEAAGELCK
jgi:invasion protein IalB